MRIADLSGIFTDKNWKEVPKSVCESHGFFPNRLFHNDVKGQAVVLINRSKMGDWAINRKALQHLINAEDNKAIVKGYVALLDKNAIVANQTSKTIQRILSDHPPLNGQYGDYNWLSEEFSVLDPSQMELPF